MTPLSGNGESKVSRPLLLEANRGFAPTINLLSSTEKAPRKKPKMPKRNFSNALATGSYACKYCEGKFSTSQSLGGHQKAHKREHAAKKQAQAMSRIRNALSQVNPYSSNPYCFGMQAVPVPRHPLAFAPRAWPASTDAFGLSYGGTPEVAAITGPQGTVWHRSCMVNGSVYQLTNDNGDPNSGTGVSRRSTGTKPPPANVLAEGSSLSTQGLENEGLDLSLRL